MLSYNVNWARFAVGNLPTDLRKVKLVSYLIALFSALKDVYDSFLALRLEQLYEAEINGQTIKLERVLNDNFDTSERRIYITDGEYYEASVFYEEYKNRSLVFDTEGDTDNPVYYSTDSLGGRVNFNFFVHVPAEVWFDKKRVEANVNKYKTFGRTFKVILI